MTIWERIAAALSGLTVPVCAGAWTGTTKTIPATYVVYSLVVSVPEAHADDREALRSYQVQVSVYSRAGLVGLPDIDSAMIAAGFVPGAQRELPFDQQTRHYGIALEYEYLEDKS